MAKKNRRTLKKRLLRIMSLCILITVLMFGSAIIILMSYMVKGQSVLVSEYFCQSVAQNMNSDYFLEQMGIDGLEEFDGNSDQAREWLKNMAESFKLDWVFRPESIKKEKFEIRIGIPEAGLQTTGDPQVLPGAALVIKEIHRLPEGKAPIDAPLEVIHIQIQINNKLVYPPMNSDDFKNNVLYNKGEIASSSGNFVQRLLAYYSSTATPQPLFDSKGEKIGEASVSIDPLFVLFTFVSIAVIILLIALTALLIVNIISRFLTFPIISPINQLADNIRSLADEDYECCMDKQIVLKKPLCEIESMVNSTNTIMQKMKKYNDLLMTQKILVESQNEELEAQNVELAESKKAIEEAQAQLVQVENMASVGQLTAAITHEINTPLAAINSNVQMCDMLLDTLGTNVFITSNEELYEPFSQIKQANDVNIMACQRVTEIIRSLKTFSKIDEAEFQEADINEGIRSVLVLTSNLWKNRVGIHTDFGILPPVKCFPGLLNQVFMNIIVNAIQAIKDKGDIHIKTFADESQVCISVKDSGTGISEEHLPRIFDTGFTTKGSGIGMGLGLSICRNIVEKHSGEIKVTSELDNGTVFTVCIPLRFNNHCNQME